MKYVLLLLLVFCATGVHADETQKHDLNLQTTSVPYLYFPPERPVEIHGQPYEWNMGLKCYVFTGATAQDSWCASRNNEGNITFARVPPSTMVVIFHYTAWCVGLVILLGIAWGVYSGLNYDK